MLGFLISIPVSSVALLTVGAACAAIGAIWEVRDRKQRRSIIDLLNTVGLNGVSLTRLYAMRGNRGSIRLNISGNSVVMDAVTDGRLNIEADTQITVTGVDDRSTLIVRRSDPS